MKNGDAANLTQEQRQLIELEIIFRGTLSFGEFATAKSIAKVVRTSVPTVYKDLQDLQEKGPVNRTPGLRRPHTISNAGMCYLRDSGIKVVEVIDEAKRKLNELEAALF